MEHTRRDKPTAGAIRQRAVTSLPGALAALLLLGALLVASAPPTLAADAPNWTLTRLDGEVVAFDDEHRRGASIILFWATWCPYCKALMPHLQSMLEEYRGGALNVYAISYREDGNPQRYLDRHGFSFDAFDENVAEVAEAYAVSGTPAVYVVDESGRIVSNLYRITAQMKNDPAWDQLSNAQKAARRAPYWAARIREALDQVYAAR